MSSTRHDNSIAPPADPIQPSNPTGPHQAVTGITDTGEAESASTRSAPTDDERRDRWRRKAGTATAR